MNEKLELLDEEGSTVVELAFRTKESVRTEEGEILLLEGTGLVATPSHAKRDLLVETYLAHEVRRWRFADGRRSAESRLELLTLRFRDVEGGTEFDLLLDTPPAEAARPFVWPKDEEGRA